MPGRKVVLVSSTNWLGFQTNMPHPDRRSSLSTLLAIVVFVPGATLAAAITAWLLKIAFDVVKVEAEINFLRTVDLI
jgi:uncharacterized membrane protein YoaK (UPF0700 family)